MLTIFENQDFIILITFFLALKIQEPLNFILLLCRYRKMGIIGAMMIFKKVGQSM